MGTRTDTAPTWRRPLVLIAISLGIATSCFLLWPDRSSRPPSDPISDRTPDVGNASEPTKPVESDTGIRVVVVHPRPVSLGQFFVHVVPAAENQRPTDADFHNAAIVARFEPEETEFLLPFLSAGEHWLALISEARWVEDARFVEVGSGISRVELKMPPLKPENYIEFHLLDPAGSPVSGASCQCIYHAHWGAVFSHTGYADEKGRYWLRHPRPYWEAPGEPKREGADSFFRVTAEHSRWGQVVFNYNKPPPGPKPVKFPSQTEVTVRVQPPDATDTTLRLTAFLVDPAISRVSVRFGDRTALWAMRRPISSPPRRTRSSGSGCWAPAGSHTQLGSPMSL